VGFLTLYARAPHLRQYSEQDQQHADETPVLVGLLRSVQFEIRHTTNRVLSDLSSRAPPARTANPAAELETLISFLPQNL